MGNCLIIQPGGTRRCSTEFDTQRECFKYAMKKNYTAFWLGDEPCPTSATLLPSHEEGGNPPYHGHYTQPGNYYFHPYHMHYHYHYYYSPYLMYYHSPYGYRKDK